MKVIYNNKEIINSTDDYNGLLNRPMINSQTLEGVITLDDIDTYTKEQIDELIGNSRSIEIVTALPTNLVANTLYYVGPDANDFYTVYLVDEVRNVIQIGTSQFGEYYGGTGINIDNDNYIHVKIDNNTIIVDSENNLHARLDISTISDFIPATSSAVGKAGLVPQPLIGDQDNQLSAQASFSKFYDIIFPINSIYITIDNTNPGTFLLGTTWEKLSVGRALANTSSGTGSSSYVQNYISRIYAVSNSAYASNGPWIYSGTFSGALSFSKTSDTNYWRSNYTVNNWRILNLDASMGTYKADGTLMTQAESPFGKSSIVQPRAIKVCMWRRTA